MLKAICGFVLMLLFGWAGAVYSASLITDTVEADRREWAQVDLFENLSYIQISNVCPLGKCLDGGVLNGNDMTGWSWASLGDVASLFNSYGIDPPLNTSTNEVESGGEASDWAPAFFDAGWRPTQNVNGTLITAGYALGENSFGHDVCVPWMIDAAVGNSDAYDDTAQVSVCTENPNGQSSYRGAWFSRPSEVPVPAAAWLFSSALCGLLLMGRTRLSRRIEN